MREFRAKAFQRHVKWPELTHNLEYGLEELGFNYYQENAL